MKTWVLREDLMMRPGEEDEIIMWIRTDDERWYILKGDGTLRQTLMTVYFDQDGQWQPSEEAFYATEL